MMSRIRRVKTHILPFIDHSGNPARMVFQGVETCPLPPLYTFSIYFTHTDIPSAVNLAGLLDALMTGNPFASYCPIRLDVYFLPAVAVDDCAAHYRREKAGRGDYWSQVNAFEGTPENAGLPSDGGNLPGLVPSYIDDKVVGRYHGLLYLCEGQDWAAGKQLMCEVLFDPISPEEYGSVKDSDEPTILPPLYIAWKVVKPDSPGMEESVGVVGMSMFERSNLRTENETTGVWQKAVEMGWESW